MTKRTNNLPKGGSFLIEGHSMEDVFTPEDFTEEHRMIARTTEAFMVKEVLPNAEEIEHQNLELVVSLLRKSADIGLLSMEIPEKYGGLGLDKASAMIITEKVALNASFSVSHGGHTGIGTSPILMFGTPEQKQKYLPNLGSGEMLAAYALTEPEAGSDALAGKTRADLSPDGKYYVLNGSKMWITNAGFADLFITFAKVGGEQFTAFIVPRNTPGLTIGKEEKKMGIKGSSTRALMFENAMVPVQNVLGEVGKGHKIAFNCLNLGRLKLGAGCIGGSKIALTEALRYAIQRRQFGRPICEFGLIKQKLAEMAIRTWVGESMIYRTTGLIDQASEDLDADDQVGRMKAVEEYAIECAITKVMGSETLDYTVDEALQIFGGNGFSQEYPIERAYRDARINRIFEGTNEINRLLIPGMMFRRALSGQLPLIPAAQKVLGEILSPPALESTGDELLDAERTILSNTKKTALLVAGAAAQKFGQKLTEEQEIVGNLSDIVMKIFALESALIRVTKLVANRGQDGCSAQLAIARTYISDGAGQIESLAKNALAAMAEGDTLKTQLAAIRRFSRYTPINTVATRRQIADAMIQAGKYNLNE
jgi:alkylation response protein AidB-like acyl-CoA dehydrogenase